MCEHPWAAVQFVCPTCQETWQRLSATYQTWLTRPFDPCYNEAHIAAVQAHIRHLLHGHARKLPIKEERT